MGTVKRGCCCDPCKNNCCPDIPTGLEACDELNKYNDTSIRPMIQEVLFIDPCVHLLDTLSTMISRQYCMNSNFIKQICAIWNEIDKLWKKIAEIEDSINQIWTKLAKVENTLDALLGQNIAVNQRYVIEYSTPEMSVTVDRSGNFKFIFTDWLDATFTKKIGQGTVTGKINFGMSVATGISAKWQIRSVYVDTVSYKSGKITDQNKFAIHVYVRDGGQTEVYARSHDAMSDFTDKVNKTVAVNMSGILNAGSSTGWIQFLEVFNDSLQSDNDDRANVQIKFDNNNQSSLPPYI